MAPVDPTAYDVILINTSAGKDSQAMLDHVMALAREAGVAQRVVAEYVNVETRIGHTFRQKLALRVIQDRLEAGELPTADQADTGAWGM
jgi:hypothetical protein